MRYYHDVVTYRDLKNPGLRVRGCEETRLRVGLGGENMSTADESINRDSDTPLAGPGSGSLAGSRHRDGYPTGSVSDSRA